MRTTPLAILTLLIAIGLLAGCGAKETAPPNLPPPPSPPAAEPIDLPDDTLPEPAGPTPDEAVLVDDTAELFAGDTEPEFGGKVGNIKCTVDGSKLVFTMQNSGEKRWQLNQAVGFPPPTDMIKLKVMINNYEANSPTAKYTSPDGVRYFGPEQPFSENCGGVEELLPGDRTTCTLYPVPLKDESDSINKNRIWLDVPGETVEYITFICT